ncbi:hypothetical protein KA005_24895 [bacterium]|nr:hypothetical protein [bacterium]
MKNWVCALQFLFGLQVKTSNGSKILKKAYENNQMAFGFINAKLIGVAHGKQHSFER